MLSEAERRGRMVTALRERHLWTREKLGEKAGLTTATISNVEAGRVSVRLGTIKKLADVLEVDPMELLHPPEDEAGGEPTDPKAPPSSEVEAGSTAAAGEDEVIEEYGARVYWEKIEALGTDYDDLSDAELKAAYEFLTNRAKNLQRKQTGAEPEAEKRELQQAIGAAWMAGLGRRGFAFSGEEASEIARESDAG